MLAVLSNLIPQGTLGKVWDIFGFHYWVWKRGAVGILQVEAKDAAKLEQCPRQYPITKSYLAQMSVMLSLRNPAIAEAGGVVEECNRSSDTC